MVSTLFWLQIYVSDNIKELSFVYTFDLHTYKFFTPISDVHNRLFEIDMLSIVITVTLLWLGFTYLSVLIDTF